MNGPSLSQYFANDPPSFFDELANSETSKLNVDGNVGAPITGINIATVSTSAPALNTTSVFNSTTILNPSAIINTASTTLINTASAFNNTLALNPGSSVPSAVSVGVNSLATGNAASAASIIAPTIDNTQAATVQSTFGFTPRTNITESTFNGSFTQPEYIEFITESEEDPKIPDNMRSFWDIGEAEPGVPPLLTTPGIQSPNDLTDVIAEGVSKYLGPDELIQRKILTADDVTQDDRGLRSLIVAGCHRAAVNLSGRLLTIYGQGFGRAGQPAKHSPHSLQLWFTRLALLFKLGEYKLLQVEAEPFDQLNRPDVFFEFYPEMYPTRKGSIASFSFRLMLSELPIFYANPQLALDNLSNMYRICSDIRNYYSHYENKIGEAFWRQREIRVLHSIINCALVMKKYNLIDDVIRDMILAESNITKEERRALFSAWGRIYLYIGDIFGAEQKFAEARRLREMNSSPDLRDLVDKGLICVAKNDFPEAFAIFQKALHLDTGNTMILNNMGVCLLYAGKLKDAINILERAINLHPQKSLNENLLINLSTLYELESSTSNMKKLNLLRLVNRYKPDLRISLELCLKLQTVNS